MHDYEMKEEHIKQNINDMKWLMNDGNRFNCFVY